METDDDIEGLLSRWGARGTTYQTRAVIAAELVRSWERGPAAARAIDRLFEETVTDAAGRGWSRDELVRLIAKSRGRRFARIFGTTGEIERWWGRTQVHPARAVRDLLGAISLVNAFMALERERRVEMNHDVDPGVVRRVRALLAKAESTNFEPEAMALMAKAQQLIARHSLDAAALDSDQRERVASRRIFLDDPYARARFHLLGQIARACGCRALWSSGLGYSTVYGFPTDLAATELLYVSLESQAFVAMAAAQARAPIWDATRVAPYRRAFLYAFTSRVGERMRKTRTDTVADATAKHGNELVPVLAAREQAVEAAVLAAHPHTRTTSWSASDGSGWAAGDAAGQRATLANQPGLNGRWALGSGQTSGGP